MSNIKNKPAAPMHRGPGMMMGAPVQKARNFKASLRQLLDYLRPYWAALSVVLVLAVLSTVFAIVSPKLLGNVTNRVVEDYIRITTYDQIATSLPAGSIRPAIDFTAIGQIVLFLLGLYIVSAVFAYAQGWVVTGVAQKVTYRLRRDIAEKMNRLPMGYFDSHAHGDIQSRVTNDVDTVSQTLSQGLSQIITSVTMVLGILVMMLSISPLMTLVAVLMLPLSFVLVGGVMSKSQGFFKRQQDLLGTLNGHVEEMYAGHTVVKVFNGEEASVEKFVGINNKLYDSAWKAQFLSGLIWPIMNFVGNIGFVAVSVLGGYQAVKGRLNIGDIQAFIQYVRQFNQPILQLANMANVLQSTVAAGERVFEFLASEEQIPESAAPAPLGTAKGAIVFDHVEFGYTPEAPVIKGFTAKIAPGQRVAIVGPTGAGKTTLVNLLMRFYDPGRGSITLDGINIRDFKRADLRRQFGMVLQDTWLFNGTLRDNILYGNPTASEEEMIRAAQSAHVDHYVHSLPGGYEMEINEEADNISQGEKQLLTIARAMLADPPMLILDEATSSVDTRTEVLIQKAMDTLMQGRTSFVIAHRLSTIRDADLILVMNDGNIVEQGTHESLLASQGFYAELYQSQFA